MRKRSEIESSTRPIDLLSLEVLLDIRDLLQKQKLKQTRKRKPNLNKN